MYSVFQLNSSLEIMNICGVDSKNYTYNAFYCEVNHDNFDCKHLRNSKLLIQHIVGHYVVLDKQNCILKYTGCPLKFLFAPVMTSN